MMAGGSNSGAPAPVSFQVKRDPSWPDEHVFYIEQLALNGIRPAELRQVDINARKDWCFVTLSCQAVLTRVMTAGLHILGCPFSLSNAAIVSALGSYGVVHGVPSKETITHNDFEVETGRRFIRMGLKKGVPSTLKVGTSTVRTWYKDQLQTCYRCKATGHVAQECPKKKADRQPAQQRNSDPRDLNFAGAVTGALDQEAQSHSAAASAPTATTLGLAQEPAECGQASAEDLYATSKDATGDEVKATGQSTQTEKSGGSAERPRGGRATRSHSRQQASETGADSGVSIGTDSHHPST